jgi:hypothetical protein
MRCERRVDQVMPVQTRRIGLAKRALAQIMKTTASKCILVRP